MRGVLFYKKGLKMYLDEIENLKTYRSGKPQFANSFKYWRNQLFNEVNKLFSWDGLKFPQKEIETRLILWGCCGIVNPEKVDKFGKPVPVTINMFDLTQFYDEFENFNYTTPLCSGKAVIGKTGVVIDNNTLRNPTINLIDRYAMLLAHTEISLVNALVNGRSSKTVVAGSNKVAENARAYLNKLYNGANDVIVDTAFAGLQINDAKNDPLAYAKAMYDIRQSLLYSFYEDLGIKKNQQKRERLVTDEVTADNMLLKLNIKDMLDARQRACEEINKLFGVNWSVVCNVDIDDDGIPEAEEQQAADIAEPQQKEGVNDEDN